MTADNVSAKELIEEAQRAHFEGWDFSYMDDRWRGEALPWDYYTYVRGLLKEASTFLDVGTGGGEFLVSLMPLPTRTFATEAHPPNVELARKRLEPLGVQVVDTSGDPSHNHLPFPDDSFDLITDRHTGVAADELWRCLSQSGRYVTEQVGDLDSIAFNKWFDDTSRENSPAPNLDIFIEQLARAGLKVIDAQEAYPECIYQDVGAVVYHLNAIPWMIPGFDMTTHRARLLDLHEHIARYGGFRVRRHRFFVHARKDVG